MSAKSSPPSRAVASTGWVLLHPCSPILLIAPSLKRQGAGDVAFRCQANVTPPSLPTAPSLIDHAVDEDNHNRTPGNTMTS